MVVLTSTSVEETVAIGERVGKLMRPGDFVALIGDLGAGKTHFVQGFARGMGIPDDVCVASPSYTLLNEYHGRLPLYHFDLYRLGGDEDVRDLGFEEYFSGDGVCVVEWADRLSSELPDENLKIVIIQTGETSRKIEITGSGSRYVELLGGLASG